MDDKSFLFTDELTKRMIRLRFQNDQLFKSTKHPWLEFHSILMQNGFPPELTLSQVRKKWSYTWDTYKIAKREKNKHWKFYKLFEKHYGKSAVLDKYESWPDDWRLKLITCVSETKQHDMDQMTMWRSVEKAMRCQDLPEDCCIQDMQGLWHHLKVTFRRKHRMKLRQTNQPSDWPLYESMLEYFGRHEPEQLVNMQSEREMYLVLPAAKMNRGQGDDSGQKEHEFQWSKDITESFIQIRLQNDWLFCQRPQAWKDFTTILKQEHGFPSTFHPRDASKKWSSTYAEYQKAKATNNTSWLYYNLFELYLGEGSLSLNPLLEWQETWALNLIEARTDLEDYFVANSHFEPSKSWREVEKRLRKNGIPLDHSMLDLPHIWSYLIRTYKWKRKFANKGVLKEKWAYFEPMTKYMAINVKSAKKEVRRKTKVETIDYDDMENDDYEDDMKLFDLKQKMELDLKPNYELGAKQCRACAGVARCVDIFEHKDDDGLDVASKLLIICGIEVQKSENLPTQICYNCLQELDNAYKFRRKCQTVHEQFRGYSKNTIKIEIMERNDHGTDHNPADDDGMHSDIDDRGKMEDEISFEVTPNIVESKAKSEPVKKKYNKRRYLYWKVCEICGVHTRHLKGHMDAHNESKPYSCEVCGKSFKFKAGLSLHKAVHDPVPKITCEVCGKKFHVNAHYRRHMGYHANERKFACDTCDKRFNSPEILRVHKRIHTDERPFDCSECGKTFRTAGCVSRHKRIVHRIIRKKVQ